jgi:hypothetical protein
VEVHNDDSAVALSEFGTSFVWCISQLSFFFLGGGVLRACLFTPMDYIIWIIFGGLYNLDYIIWII